MKAGPPFRVQHLDPWTPIFNQLAAEYERRQILREWRPLGWTTDKFATFEVTADVKPYIEIAERAAAEIARATRPTLTMRGYR